MHKSDPKMHILGHDMHIFTSKMYIFGIDTRDFTLRMGSYHVERKGVPKRGSRSILFRLDPEHIAADT